MPLTKPSDGYFGILFFKRQWRLFGIMFKGFCSPATGLFTLLVILSLLIQVVIYEAGLVPSMYFEVLGAKDYNQFKSVAIYSIEIIAINALMKSSVKYVSRLVYVKWREMTCMYIHNRYFSGNQYYKLNVMEPTLDNIDQRVLRDVNFMCEEWSALVPNLVVIPFTILYYSYKCFLGTTYLGPIIIYLYFICGTIINKFIMSTLVRVKIEREKYEGDFRFQHVQVRVNAEAMAFYDAERIEKHKSNQRLEILVRSQKKLYGWAFWLNSSVNIFDFLGGILGYLIIAGPIFGGQYDKLAPEELSALISRNAFFCAYLAQSFSKLFNMASAVSDIAGHTHRLGELLEEFDKNEEKEMPQILEEDKFDKDQENNKYEILVNERDFCQPISPTDEYIQKTPCNGLCKTQKNDSEEKETYFELKNITYSTPGGGNELLKNLSLNLSHGTNVLVTGQTGIGRTSLFRILCGLWEPCSGIINRFCPLGLGAVMFLPPKPLCTDGTLKELLVYPSFDAYEDYSLSSDDEKIHEILDEVGLSDLCSRMGGLTKIEEVNWADKLSPGEMQQLSFARLLYHNPRFAVLDEPTNALNEEMVDKLFGLCKKRNITLLTAGHSSALRKHHDIQLRLLENQSWELLPISK